MGSPRPSDLRLTAWYDRALTRAGFPYASIEVPTAHGLTHVLAAGAPGGAPVVLVPGVGTNGPALWLPTMRALVPSHRVYAVDVPGHPGRSASTSISSRGPGFGEWLSDVLDGLGHPEATFVGASLGSYIILKLATVAPRRITRAVLSAPAGVVPISKRGLLRLAPHMVVNRVFPDKRHIRALMGLLLSPAAPLDEELVELLEIAFEPGRVSPDQSMLPALPPRALAHYHAPTLVLAGEHDILLPAAAVEHRAPIALPGAAVHVVSGMGHVPGPADVDLMTAMLLAFCETGAARSAPVAANRAAR
jgi:pimeloyl-ACP methyl ester carboxylesterase